MSLTPSPVSRTTPPAERSQQRAERAPAGDFAALLDLAPAPARAPLARSAERHDRHASPGHDDRPEGAAHARARSRHGRPEGGHPSAAPVHGAPAPEDPHGRGSQAPDAGPPASPAVAGPAPVAETAAPADLAAPVLPVAIDAAAPAADPACAPPAGDAAPVAVISDPPAAPAPPAQSLPAGAQADGHAAGAGRGPALAFAPAGLPLGTTPATGVERTSATDPVLAALPAAGVPLGAETTPPPAASAAAAAAGATATAEPVGTGVPVPGAPDARTEGEPAPAATGEPLIKTSADGSGTGTGTGFAGARDGEGAAGGEPADVPAGVPAPVSHPAPAPSPGAGRGPDAVPFGLQRSVLLERAPRAVAQLLHVASEAGVSHARIALRPVELGGIEIFLQVSPAGLAAQVIADSPEAARMLAQATEDLRRSLAGQNVELVSIDVSTSAEQQQREELASSGFVADDRAADGRPARRRADEGPDPAPATAELTTPTVLELPDGLLVDVLA